MGYKLKRGEGFADGIARVVDEQLEGAVGQLRGEGDADADEAVHDVRKRLKKSRSALRLARDDLGDATRGAENDVLRRAGRRLSGARDAQVLLQTLALLKDELSAPAYGAMRDVLEQRRDALGARQQGSRDAAGEIADELEALRGRIADWPLADASFRSAGRGLRRIHERGRRAMDVALAGGSDDDWHEWRKRVKDLWYSLRILQPVARAQLAGMVDEADELSDVLGDHNDLAVLLQAVDEHRDVLGDDRAAELRAAASRRRDRLRLSAVPLGKRLYAESPRRFGRRVKAYWERPRRRGRRRGPLAHAGAGRGDQGPARPQVQRRRRRAAPARRAPAATRLQGERAREGGARCVRARRVRQARQARADQDRRAAAAREFA